MYLIYTDETGSSFKRDSNGIFRDGPFFIYGGLAVDINKYEEIENSFKDLCKSILGITNILDKEIHAGHIFYKLGDFKDLPEKSLSIFFSETLQLLAKFNVITLLGISCKQATILKSESEILASSMYSFFSSLDLFLSKHGKRGLIIADEYDETALKKYGKADYFKYLSDDKNLIGKGGGVDLSVMLRRIFYERSNRYSGLAVSPILNMQYKYESKMYFVLDNIFYVESRLSIFTQLADIALFAISILFEVLYLEPSGIKISEEKISFTRSLERTMAHFFFSCVEIANLSSIDGAYDSVFHIIRNNPFIVGDPFKILRENLTSIKEVQTCLKA